MTSAQVLVVEDERIVAKSIQSELRSMGYRVPVTAATAEEAIDRAMETHPDVVLMDIVLKGERDGIAAAEEVRTRLDIPVIFLTAYGDEETLRRAKAAEPFGYLLKPYEEKELQTTIEMALYKHRVEKQLREMNRWLDATLRSIRDAVLATDGRQYVRLINPAGERLLRCEQELVTGEDLMKVCPLTQGDNAEILETIAKQARATGQAVDFPAGTVLLSPAERRLPVEGSVAPINDDEGNFTGLVVVLHDISVRAEMDQLRQQNESHQRRAEKMDAISRLAGGVAHEFNNLLTAILGNTSLVLATMPRSDSNLHQVVQIETAALRAAEVVRQLFAFSGRSGAVLDIMSMNDAVQHAADPLRRTLDSRVRLEVKLAPDLWPVHGDRAQMGEMLRNLCQNAQEAMSDGGTLTLETTNVSRQAEHRHGPWRAPAGDYVRLSVSDSGEGLTPEAQERLFEPFYTTRQSGAVSGLGMALVFGIVEEHDGWIECQSEVGHGTQFDIYLPRYGQNTERPAAAPAPTPTPAKASTMAAATKTATILLADDEPMIRDLTTNILQRYGYQVLLAEDGLQALEIYERERDRIDLVILDLTMPRLSGDDTCRRLLALDPKCQILLSSGYFPEDLTLIDPRVFGFLSKPYRHEELVSTVRAALEQRKSSDTEPEIDPGSETHVS
jgi:two-component system, cell cycle sensor histidine kinase and response regulator CckA